MGLCHRGGVSASEMGARLLNARYLNCLLPRHVAVRACCLTYLVIVYDGGPRGHLAEARFLIVATLSPVVWDAPQMVYVTMAELSPMFYLMFSGFQLIPGSYPTHTRLIPWRGRPPGVRRRMLGDELRPESRQSMEKEMNLLGGGRDLCD